MRRRFRPGRPSPALVISVVALVFAMGGTGYAAFHLGKNTVGTKQLKNGAVTNGKLANGAVTNSKLANGAVTAAKLNTTGVTVPNALHANTAASATSATNATNAATLAGSPPSAFESSGNLLSAVVTNNGSTATVVRGTAGVTANRVAQGGVEVTFPQDVSKCTWVATQGNPASSVVMSIFATVRGDGNASDVFVVTFNQAGTQTDANFHLLVLC
jgi:hypothetical protein